ncbi:MAG: YkvA family protein [Phormidesmis sp.]
MNNLVESFYSWYRGALRHPVYGWLIVLGTVAYLVSPIDISPDFIPIIGWIDDGILATLLISEVSSLAMDYLKKNKGVDVADGNPKAEESNVIDVEVS